MKYITNVISMLFNVIKMCDVTSGLHLMVLLNLILMSNGCHPGLISKCIINLCNEKCAYIDLNQVTCKYGYQTDICGITFCAKGPGDICGDKYSHYGICGRGLICSQCGRCTGCSIFSSSIDCFDDSNCLIY